MSTATKPGARSRSNGPALSVAPQIATLEELRSGREVVALLPSGNRVRIRPPNMELYALSGKLPSRLTKMATIGAAGLNRQLGEEGNDEARQDARDFLVNIVREMVVEPDMSGLRTWEELDGVFIPEDFHFLVDIGNRERDHDAEGKRLWGIEPLSRWETFCELHGCTPDCQACLELQRRFSVATSIG